MRRPEITEDMRERLNQALADLWADDGQSDFVELLDAQKLAICGADQLTALRERVKELESAHRSAISLLSENRPDAAHAAYQVLWRAREPKS